MPLIIKLTLRRLRSDIKRTLLIAAALLLSSAMISAFIFFEVQLEMTENPAYAALPFGEFMRRLRYYINVTVTILSVLTLLAVRSYSAKRNEDNLVTLAVLTSIGASKGQKRGLIITEIFILYMPPVLLGIPIGIIPGIKTAELFLGAEKNSNEAVFVYFSAAVLIFAVLMLAVIVCCCLPEFKLRRRSAIRYVRRQNKNVSEERHGYRESHTYKSQAVLKKLAVKNAEYHYKEYNRIVILILSALLYPITAAVMLVNVGNTDVVIDSNPYDGVDTSAAVTEIINGIFVFIVVCFLILSCLSILQAVLMYRIQIAERRHSARAYLSIGMTRRDMKKMISLEIRSVFLKVAVCAIFALCLICACYGVGFH